MHRAETSCSWPRTGCERGHGEGRAQWDFIVDRRRWRSRGSREVVNLILKVLPSGGRSRLRASSRARRGRRKRKELEASCRHRYWRGVWGPAMQGLQSKVKIIMGASLTGRRAKQRGSTSGLQWQCGGFAPPLLFATFMGLARSESGHTI